MGTVHLLNAAMMPQGNGIYKSEAIDAQTFSEAVRAADTAGILKSYIGYPETAQMLFYLTGVEISVNRSETKIVHGDAMLIAKLKYRVGLPSDKGSLKPDSSDFEFRRVLYTKE